MQLHVFVFFVCTMAPKDRTVLPPGRYSRPTVVFTPTADVAALYPPTAFPPTPTSVVTDTSDSDADADLAKQLILQHTDSIANTAIDDSRDRTATVSCIPPVTVDAYMPSPEYNDALPPGAAPSVTDAVPPEHLAVSSVTDAVPSVAEVKPKARPKHQRKNRTGAAKATKRRQRESDGAALSAILQNPRFN